MLFEGVMMVGRCGGGKGEGLYGDEGGTYVLGEGRGAVG